MPCYHPLKGYMPLNPVEKKTVLKPSKDYPILPAYKKPGIVFNHTKGYYDQKITVPCGRCIGCRLEKSRQWALRCMHEAQLYEENCFITLTYDEDNLPSNLSLNKTDITLFLKRLRKQNPEKIIRYYQCGEYGENFERPHHHAIIFNHDFNDKQTFKNNLYISPTLEKLWQKGFCTVGNVTFQSAQYVASYCLKKITGEPAKEHYQGKMPEYATMSRRPGLGTKWLQIYQSDIYPSDNCMTQNGVQGKPPKFYDNILAIANPDMYYQIKAKRFQSQRNNSENQSDRLLIREICKKAKLSINERKQLV